MAAEVEAATSPAEAIERQAETSRRARWWLWLGIGVVGPVVLVAMAMVAVYAYFRAESQRAARVVAAEVARIQAAGEPITSVDMYAYHRVPAGVPDLTREWLAVLASFDEQKFNSSGANLPVVGNAPATLDPQLAPEEFAKAQQLLRDFDAALQAALAVGRKPGECRFPVEFDQGIAMQLPYANKIRCVSTLLALDVRVKALGGDVDGAVTSAEAMYGVPRAMQKQMTLIEQLVGMATLAMAIRETEFLLNGFDLSDEQLARLAAAAGSFDAQDGLTHGLIGERAMGFHTFHHADLLDGLNGGAMPPQRIEGEGRLSRPADCQFYLELMGETVAASRQPAQQAEAAMDKVEMRLKGVVGSKNPLEKFRYLFTALLAPATRKAFTAATKRSAERDVLVAAIAAERYRLKTGQFPTALSQLVPEFLPAVPADPFGGGPLRMVNREGELIVYSVGEDRQDDGGSDPASDGVPDIVVTVREKKGIDRSETE
jgi:hypothetical protein